MYALHTRLSHVWRRLVCSVGALLTKFLHRSSVRSLLRVCCWLGSSSSSCCDYLCSTMSMLSTKYASVSMLQVPSSSRPACSAYRTKHAVMHWVGTARLCTNHSWDIQSMCFMARNSYCDMKKKTYCAKQLLTHVSTSNFVLKRKLPEST